MRYNSILLNYLREVIPEEYFDDYISFVNDDISTAMMGDVDDDDISTATMEDVDDDEMDEVDEVD